MVMVPHGPFPQEINEKSVKLAVSDVSLNFLHDFVLFVVDIHQIRLISLFRRFSDHFHPMEQKRVIDLRPCRIYSNFNHRHCLGLVDVGKAVVHHRKPPFFALGSKKLLVWLPAPVREFSQSGATENEGADAHRD